MGKSRFVFRFLALNFIFLALPLFIATTISLQNFYDKTVAQGKAELSQIAALRSITLGEWQPSNLPTSKTLIYFLKLGQEKPNYEELSKQLKEVVKGFPDYIYAIISPLADVNEGHRILATSLVTASGENFRNLYEQKEVMDKGQGIVMRYFNSEKESRSETKPYIMSLLVYYDAEKKPAGIFVQAVDMSVVIKEVLSTTYFSSLNFAILNDQKIVMAASDKSFEGHYLNNLSKDLKHRIMESRDLGTIVLAGEPIATSKTDDKDFFEFKWNGNTQIANIATIPYMDLSVLVYTPKSFFFNRALKQYITLYIVYLTILVLGVITVILLGTWISRPLRQLSGLMEEVSQGNFDVKFYPQKLGYEMNLLGGIFNTTLESLKSTIKHAEDERVKREIYQRELDLGREVQKGLFPASFPQEKGIELAGCYIPSEKVSGDFYLIEQHKKGILIAIIDIEGKGIHSSFYALSLRSLLRTYATMFDDVGEMMTRVNASFASESDVHATALVALYDPKSQVLHYTSCGHLPAIIKRANNEVEELEALGRKLGEDVNTSFETKSVQLAKDDFVFFYTDGLTNAQNEKNVAIETEGVKRLIKEGDFVSAEEGIEALNHLWEEHTGEKTPADEILILTCKIKSSNY